MKILKKMFKTVPSEDDFKDAPITDEGDGVFQMLFIGSKIYTRNVDTGEIAVLDNDE